MKGTYTKHEVKTSTSMEAKKASSALAFLFSFFLAFLLLLPFTTSYETKAIDSPRRISRLSLDPVFGPESLAFDHRGEGPYTGVSDGRVLKWRGRGLGWTEFAYNARYRKIGQCTVYKNRVAPESMCGRPLGLQFHKKSGNLYIADAYLGLLRVGPGGGLATVLASEADGVPFKFLNGLDVDQETGEVYFTDSSTTYRRSDYLMVVLSGDATGRLMKFDPRANRVTVLNSGLAFPNGVAVSPDRTHLVVAHTSSCRVQRYWIRGPKKGESELFAELPGYPDNARPDPTGGYWVALNRDKTQMNGPNSGAASAVAVRLSGQGRVLEVLNGVSNSVTVSEVMERNGTLWLGSVDVPYVDVFRA